MKAYTKHAAVVLLLVLAGGPLAGCSTDSASKPSAGPVEAASLPAVTVYKSATCGCCTKWADHMKQAGFAVTTVDVTDLGAKKVEHGVPGDLSSCHTAVVDGYVVEGHVPADVVKQMLRERPAIVGVAVPGMPIGSPGMEQGDRKEPYDVVAIGRSGERYVYASR